MYTVTSPAGCTVTDETGLQLGTVEAGEQKTFVATGAQLAVDDDTARVTATFNRAALALGLLGGGVKTPAWVKELESALAPQMPSAYIVEYKSGTLLVHSDYEQQEGLADVVTAAAAEYAPEGTPLVQKWMPPEGTTLAQYQSVWKARAVNISEYAPQPNLTSEYCNHMFKAAKVTTLPPWVFETCTSGEHVFLGSAIEVLPKKFMFPNVTTSWRAGSHGMFPSCKKLQEIPVEWTFEKLEYGSEFASECTQLRRAHGLNLHRLKEGNNFMYLTQVDKKTALLVLLGIPDRANPEMDFSNTTGKLVLGIHRDFANDSEVAEAVAEAETKGWTLTVQWNGTAGEYAQEASTFALRRRMPVWARLGEPLEDGTQRLDWGHYVTNAEENGYTEFASLEEAKEHFNITD